jgi:Beta/Gamma crystallin
MTGDERYDTCVALLARRTLRLVALVAATLTGALLLAPVGPLAVAAPASSTNPSAGTSDGTAAPRTHKVTVLYLDAATGAVVRTATRVVPTPAQASATGVVSPAIGRVSNCTDPNTFWVVRNGPPLVCFANAGDVNVAIFGVFEVDAGNNVGSFTWHSSGGSNITTPLARWTSAAFSTRVTVTHIHIN